MQAKMAIREVGRVLQKAGPYVLLEVVMRRHRAGVLLYLYRTGQLRKLGQAGRLIMRGAGSTFGALAFALQPPGSFAPALREHGVELQTLAASR